MFSSQLQRARQKVGLDVFKNIVLETVTDVYMNALPVDEVGEYTDTLKESVVTYFNETFSTIDNRQDLAVAILGNKYITPLMIESVRLAESVAEAKEFEVTVQSDFPEVNIAISPEDKAVVEEFNSIQGSSEYGRDILEKVIDAFTAEKELAEIRKEQTEDLIAALGDGTEELTESALSTCLNSMSVVPDTLFQAIVVNKSKLVLAESANSGELGPNKHEILAESLCEYALLETFNCLGLKTFGTSDVSELKFSYFSK